MTLFHALVVLFYAITVEARRGGGGRGSSVDLGLNPLNTGTFGVSVTWTILSFILLLMCLSNFKRRQPEDDYPRRIGVAVFLVLAAFCITTSWSLSTYFVSQLSPTAAGERVTVGLCNVVGGLLFRLTHVFFMGALFVILDWRVHLQAVQYGHTKSKHFATVVRFGVPSLLLVIIALAIARARVEANFYTNESLKSFISTRNTYFALSHAIVVFQVLAVIAIVGTTIVVWANRRPESAAVEIAQLDEKVLKRILYDISPFIAIQAIYELIVDIILAAAVVDGDSFLLADTIIEGLIFLWIILVAGGMGMRPKKEREEEQVAAKGKA